MQIVTNQFQKELKKHGSDHFPFLVSYEKLSGYEQGYFYVALASGDRDHTGQTGNDVLQGE